MNNYYYYYSSLTFILCCYLLVFVPETTHCDPRYEPLEGQYYDSQTTLFTQLSGPFQLCLACKCCAATGTPTPTPTCVTMPCCFAIDCQIPGKPFGVCAFVPKTCDCTSCAV